MPPIVVKILQYLSWRSKQVRVQITSNLKEPLITFLISLTLGTLILFDKNILVIGLFLMLIVTVKRKWFVLTGVALGFLNYTAWFANYDMPAHFSNGNHVELKLTITQRSTPKSFFRETVATVENFPFKVLVQTPATTILERGEMITAICEMKPPKNYPGSNFNYVQYLHSKNIYFICQIDEFEVIGENYDKVFGDIKNHISLIFQKHLSEPSSSILNGIFLGDRSEMPSQVEDVFKNTGTLHITAVSGLHFSLIAAILLAVLKFINLKTRLSLVSFWLFLYLLVLGLDNISASRAFLMILGISFSILVGRKTSALRILFIIACVSILLYPPIIWNVSFALSYTATMAILLFFPRVDYLIQNYSKRLKPYSSFIAVFASVSIATIPLSLIYFGGYSLVGFTGNVLSFLFLGTLIVLTLLGIITAFIPVLSNIIFNSIEFLITLFYSILKSISELHFVYSSDFVAILLFSCVLFLPILCLDLIDFRKKYIR